jgi:hypothetical protein
MVFIAHCKDTTEEKGSFEVLIKGKVQSVS